MFAVSFHADRVELWRADSFTKVDVGDLSLLTLVRTTARSVASPVNPLNFSLARMAARIAFGAVQFSVSQVILHWRICRRNFFPIVLRFFKFT